LHPTRGRGWNTVSPAQLPGSILTTGCRAFGRAQEERKWEFETMSLIATEQELRAFVGRNADYYLRVWNPALFGQGRVSGFNLFAFLGSGLWLPYRKMYKATFILFVVVLAELLWEQFLFVGLFRMPGSPRVLTLLVALGVGIVTGLRGNGWYLSHALRVIAEVRSRGFPADVHFQVLARRGGTSLGASLGLSFLSALFFVFLPRLLPVIQLAVALVLPAVLAWRVASRVAARGSWLRALVVYFPGMPLLGFLFAGAAMAVWWPVEWVLVAGPDSLSAANVGEVVLMTALINAGLCSVLGLARALDPASPRGSTPRRRD
jgi:hypothetical protein